MGCAERLRKTHSQPAVYVTGHEKDELISQIFSILDDQDLTKAQKNEQIRAHIESLGWHE